MKKTFFALVLLLSGSLIACNENEPEAEMKEPEKEKTVMTVEMQQQMTPRQALDKLMEGNARFLEGGRKDIDYLAQVETTATGQYPYAVILNCIDSRTPAEIFFDQGVGDIFHARIAGNFVNTDILGSLEFATKVAGSKLIMVLGHTHCGAVKGACDNVEMGNLTPMLDNIEPAVEAAKTKVDGEYNSKNEAFVNETIRQNVILNIEKMKEQSPIIKEMADKGEIMIVGAIYDIETGKVELMDM